MEMEEENILGIGGIYDTNPQESVNVNELTPQEKQEIKKEVQNKQKAPQKKAPQKAPQKPARKVVQVSKEEIEQFKQILNLFDAEFENMPNYELVKEDLQKLDGNFEQNKKWIAENKQKIKADKVVPTDKQWNDITNQAKTLFDDADKLFAKYKGNGIFDLKQESLDNMKQIFLNNEYMEKFDSAGLIKEYRQARQKVQEFLTLKEETINLHNSVQNKYNEVKKGFKEVEAERNKQKARLGEKAKTK